jgi:hypothetical protein
MTFEISDWVKGNTEVGELIQGYIESIHDLQGIIDVNVLRSDNDEIIGTVVHVPQHRLKKLPVISFEEENNVRALIDIALAARDEAWFMELSQTLMSIDRNTDQVENLSIAYLPSTNRLGLKGLK